ncbi:hypothetical protein [Spongiactinospora gelatinilytica]|uniref:hypothetical protein n=1 Tax=Spongiactinospora gelatinilytica TaxID=2666298 RepID=UPI0011B9426D|nr:hypothetical protein [Spongiactinospora gelatinilytica]
MIHVHSAGIATVSITIRHSDETTLVRRWYICDGCAGYLAAQLGSPDSELLATSAAVQAASDVLRTTPGIVATGDAP